VPLVELEKSLLANPGEQIQNMWLVSGWELAPQTVHLVLPGFRAMEKESQGVQKGEPGDA